MQAVILAIDPGKRSGFSIWIRGVLATWGPIEPGDELTAVQAARVFDPRYSAAWKLLGKAQSEAGALVEARETFRQGIAAAEATGDIQAAKEMTVFAKRIDKQLAAE